MKDLMPALISSEKGTIITIEVSAGSKDSCFPAGYNAWRKAIGCRVKAPAEEGKANREAIRLVAERLNIQKNRISIRAGTSSPVKKIHVEGMTPDQVNSVLSPAI